MLPELKDHPDPIIRYKYRVNVLGEIPQSRAIKKLRQEIKQSDRIQLLLSDRDAKGEIPFHPYTKWQGAHWVLTVLADTGYPPGDADLLPLREQVYGWLLSDEHDQYIREHNRKLNRVRLHGSQEANAIFSMLTLGLADARVEQLVERLLWAQWEDGGWNCDRRQKADTSSFWETITPLRALALYARLSGDAIARVAAERAAEVFLKRHLYKRVSDGEVMNSSFLQLRTPVYWYYDILFGLKVMAEGGWISDPRCGDALDVLESKRLPEGWFAAEGKHYFVNHTPGEKMHAGSRVAWGATNRRKPNEFITVDALYVLRTAGRSKPDQAGETRSS
jgi:hypothetical protein